MTAGVVRDKDLGRTNKTTITWWQAEKRNRFEAGRNDFCVVCNLMHVEGLTSNKMLNERDGKGSWTLYL